MRLAIAAGLIAAATAQRNGIQLTIITPHGYVQFVAADDWPIIASQSKMPVAVMAFQILDPADDGTSDSTNLAVSLYDQNSVQGREAMRLVGKKYGSADPSVTRLGGW